jgi:hypothetical protein
MKDRERVGRTVAGSVKGDAPQATGAAARYRSSASTVMVTW